MYDREIAYDRETHEYAMRLDNTLVGFARSYHEAEITLDQLVYELLSGEPPYTALSMSADPEPDPPAECGTCCDFCGVEWGGVVIRARGNTLILCWPCLRLYYDNEECMVSWEIIKECGPDVPLDGPSEDEEGGPGGEPPPDEALAWECLHASIIALRFPLGGGSHPAWWDTAAAPHSPPPTPTPLDRRRTGAASADNGYYFAGFGTVYLHIGRRDHEIRYELDLARAERLAARLNAMRCREVA